MKASRLAALEEFDFLGIQFAESSKERQHRPYASRDLKAEKVKLIDKNKELFKTQPEGWREKTQENAAKVKVLNNNIEISDRNVKNIKRYKEGCTKILKNLKDYCKKQRMNANPSSNL